MESAFNMMEDHISAIKNAIIHEHLDKGGELGDRFESICLAFRGFDDPAFDLKENKDLLDDLLLFEKEVCVLEALNFLYGYIARMYLQTGDAERCIMYAQAALEVNRNAGDSVGVSAAQNVICDCAIAHDASAVAVEYFSKAQPYQIEMIEMLKMGSNDNEGKIRKILARKRRPVTYKYLETEQIMLKEQSVRFLMAAQGMSRETAKKYVMNR